MHLRWPVPMSPVFEEEDVFVRCSRASLQASTTDVPQILPLLSIPSFTDRHRTESIDYVNIISIVVVTVQRNSLSTLACMLPVMVTMSADIIFSPTRATLLFLYPWEASKCGFKGKRISCPGNLNYLWFEERGNFFLSLYSHLLLQKKVFSNGGKQLFLIYL